MTTRASRGTSHATSWATRRSPCRQEPAINAAGSAAVAAHQAVETRLPLYVDLDGTLIATDLLHESLLKLVRSAPAALPRIPHWLNQGRAVLKHELAQRAPIDVTLLPYRESVIDLVRQARAQGRRVVLATASDQLPAQRIAEHLGLFDAVLASDGNTNLSGKTKLAMILDDMKAGGHADFAYAGDHRKDLPIWEAAAQSIVVEQDGALSARLRRAGIPAVSTLQPQRATWRDVAYGLRLHQWLKNVLVVLPLLPMLHDVRPAQLMATVFAFLVFGFMASSIYVLNDLLDLEADRRHARKRRRPFASGRLSVVQGLALSAGLMVTSLVVAVAALPWQYTGWLLVYLALTTGYSVRFKRRAVLDVCVLAALYTLRILAGAAAVGAPLSLWILSFSIFLFLSLALAKRYVEIAAAQPGATTALGARGYRAADQTFVIGTGVAAGQMAVLVLNLYLNDPLVSARYAHPHYLWLLAPILLFWVLRVWLKASRGSLHDDPVVFALRDHVSRLLGLAAAALTAAAVWS